MKVNEYLPNTFQILTSKFRFDLMHWNVSIGPEKWHIIGRFLTLFPLKRPARREKNTSNIAATIGDVTDDVTCKCSIALLPYIIDMTLVILIDNTFQISLLSPAVSETKLDL
jgi:hypothetical protein